MTNALLFATVMRKTYSDSSPNTAQPIKTGMGTLSISHTG